MATSVCIRKCRERLDRAADGIVLMQSAQSLEEAERGWSEFLLAVASIYNKLEQGSKVSGQNSAWFGRVKKERKDDHLLRYLHHARNSDEHTIDDITTVRDWSYDLKPTQSSESGFREYRVKSSDKPSWVLKTVSNTKFGYTFDPPGWHMGEALIDESPINVAKVALAYVRQMVEVAEALGI